MSLRDFDPANLNDCAREPFIHETAGRHPGSYFECIGQSRLLLSLQLLMGAAICLMACGATAQTTSSNGEPRWLPFVQIGFQSGDERTGATVTSAVGPGSTGSNSFQTARFRFGAGVLGPQWTAVPGRPRFFIRGGVDLSDVGSEDVHSAGAIGRPEDDIPPSPPDGPPEDVAGQGQLVREEFIGPAWHVGLGLAFDVPAPWEDGKIRLKPELAYEGEQMRIEGRLTQVSSPATGVFVVHRARARSDPRMDHRLGVGGEIEFMFWEGKRAEMSVFANAHYLWLLGGRSSRIGDPAGLASFEWRTSANIVRGGAGLRLSWKGLSF